MNRKQGTKTLVSYAQDFATSIKKSIKAVTKWSVHYFTSRERWYPLPDAAVSLASLQFPKRTKSLPGKMLYLDQKREVWDGHLSTELLHGNETFDLRQRWQEEKPFQKTHILRSLHQFLKTKVQTQMNNQWKSN